MVDAASPNEASSAKRYWAIYGPTIFLSASLLFFVQPLFAKMVLPILGGAPAVWTTAMLFFQSALILGYGYAHVLSRYVNVSGQMAIHATLWIAAAISLPLAVNVGWQFDPEGPIATQTLMVFAAGVGLPFVALSANAPLIQHWYAQLDTGDADNPYVLYGASNLGSLMSLLAFPLVAEPLFGATAISTGWSVLFAVLGFALLATSATALKGAWKPALIAPASRSASAAPGLKVIAHWAFLAFLPSSLMLAVTSKIATDFGSIPLVWVVPLALYLLTFVLVFTRKPLIGASALRWMALASIALLLGVYGGKLHLSLALGVGLIAAFFALTLFAHDRLYRARPAAEHLTLFYLVMSCGGALGGFFNSIIAPAVFNDLLEGPVTLALIAMVLAWGKVEARGVAIAVVSAAVFVASMTHLPGLDISMGVFVAAVLLVSFALVFVASRNNAALAVFVPVALGLVLLTGQSDARLKDRSFFGTHTVLDREGIRYYANGSTLHGSQRVDDVGATRPEPLTYYHTLAPMGQIMTSARGRNAEQIGIVGLGVGALACHAQPGQAWQFYEIDPLVDEIARDSTHFTYLSQCTPDAPTHLGDARVVLAGQSVTYDVLVIDAYSSDAVPMHLTTLEAMQLYMDRLAEDGLLVMHISNRYFSLEAPLARLAAELGLEMRIQRYGGSGDSAVGDRASVVAVLAQDVGGLGEIASDERWTTPDAGEFPLWTDDYANPLSALVALQ